ncbi:MAG: hypothetical protein QF918_13115, partial [Pirellulaceae bacterium]|nr:hypothetical protein [Pirellulaceae bacterium]
MYQLEADHLLNTVAKTLLEEVTRKQAVRYVVAHICAENLAFPDESLYLVVQPRRRRYRTRLIYIQLSR